MLYDSPLDLINKTPLVYLKDLSLKNNCQIYLKLEKFNLTGSIKDRAIKNMLLVALKNKQINQDSTIIEATSGNSGISLASLCACLSLKCLIVMPENSNLERIKLIRAYKAKIIFTKKEDKMQGSINKVQELLKIIPNSFTLNQFDNINNIKANYQTAKEIIEDLPQTEAIFASYGTGGTISGIAKYLKNIKSNTKVICVTPETKEHQITGVYSNITPKNLDLTCLDDFVSVKDDDSFKMVDYLASIGLLVGLSSGLILSGALKYLKNQPLKKIVVICPDGGERYLSHKIFSSKIKLNKKDIQDDFDYIYELIQNDNYLSNDIWSKYHLTKKQIIKLKDAFEIDANSYLENDPAAKSMEEVKMLYPGLYATFAYRLAHIFWENQQFLLARTISEYAHSKTAIDIHPQAKIGQKLTIDHGNGLVIGQTTIIGNNVRLYQNVTLGATSLNEPLKYKGQKRHPTIKDNVIIYANATILGGQTIIGSNSIIGSNVLITSSIPSNSIVTINALNYQIKAKK